MNIDRNLWQLENVALAPLRLPTRPLRVKLYGLLLALDLATLFVAFVAGSLIRFGEVPVEGWAGVASSITALYYLASISGGAYSLDVLRSPTKGIARAVGALLLAFALLFLLSYFLKVQQEISRAMTGTSLVLGLLGLAAVRQFAGEAIRRSRGKHLTNEVLLMDGTREPPCSGMTVIDAAAVGIRPDPTDLTMQMRFVQLLENVDRVVISCSREAAVGWAQMLKSTDTYGELLSRDFDYLAPLGVSRCNGATTLVVSVGPLNIRQRMLKRLMDTAFTLVALFLLAPVMLGIALIIKLDSRGPVLFKQPRIGRNNRLFTIYKFRTMRVAESDLHGAISTCRGDGRLTRVGGFLRRTSLDELPQFLNVLCGSMSIVGPRPHALGSLAGEKLFWHVDSRYWQRHVLKPGITGLAQIRGLRGATHTREHLSDRLQSDLEYVSGWSLWNDAVIVARTLRVLVHPQAY